MAANPLSPLSIGDYLERRQSVEGWFEADAVLLFVLCNQLIAAQGILGDVLEIGVHHGLSAIVTAALRGPDNRFYAADLFGDLQDLNTSGSGRGDKDIFLDNMREFHGGLAFMEVIVGPSSQLTVQQLGENFSFCHVDGGHSASETYEDIALCERILRPGGLVALDDYFNYEWPAVSEGASRYMLANPAALVPVAVGFNKAIFQKQPATIELDAYLAEQVPDMPRRLIDFWGRPTMTFPGGLTSWFNLDQSTMGRVVPAPMKPVSVRLDPHTRRLKARPGEHTMLRVRIVSQASEPIRFNTGRFGLSYHLMDDAGAVLQWDNLRNYLEGTLPPGRSWIAELPVRAPHEAGHYGLELDIVWEGVAWLKQRGLRTAYVDFQVSQ